MPKGIPANRHGFCEKCGNAFELRGPLQKYCESCKLAAYAEKMRLYSANYYRRHPERVKLANKRSRAKRHDYYLVRSREDQRKGRDRLRRLVIGTYSNQRSICACCGESEFDFLTIDHINGKRIDGGPGTYPQTGYPLYRWLVRNQFPQGYQVLCMNCNVSKGKHGVCVHYRNAPSNSN